MLGKSGCGGDPCRGLPKGVGPSCRGCHWGEILAAHACGTSSSGTLQIFCRRLIHIPYLHDSHINQLFLHPAVNLKSACGPEREIKVFAEQDDINLEYCDMEGADKDCNLLFDGRPVRHVRLDARVAVIDEIKRKEKTLAKTVSLKKFQEEEAPWFI